MSFRRVSLVLWTAACLQGGPTSAAGDAAEHWAFQPVRETAPPEVRDVSWPRQPIDRFLLSRLEKEGLRPNPPADRTAWLRRVTFDLTGLPPTPEAVDRFLADRRPDAEERVVDALLASPRHGERWTQHWLDVVRYADTHGFEVNTERPNAWPYRDHVIAALNADVPFGRFVRDQVAGDRYGADAATGFLVTASVLLPGQIGADAASKRLARQDALDEIVVNASQAFLGISLGCARCHDHKSDPFTSRDYYSMQAFFAGVEYEDREIRSPELEARRKAAEPLRERLDRLGGELARFEPLARTGLVARVPDARRNVEEFPPLEARFVRFVVHDTRVHPTLGRIEPCLDELEVLTDEDPPRNVALASLGAKVVVSGSRVSDRHRPEHVNDGLVGNDHSWMSDEAGRGWVRIELPRPTRIRAVAWGRDREGRFDDRLPTSFTLEVGNSPDSMRPLVHVPPPRPAVRSTVNTDRFLPVRTRRLRFVIRATNHLEPCLDEVEVFDLSGRNVALAASGTTVRTSGDTVVEGRHLARHLNDGEYGNSRSWMGDQPGRGWVELTLPEATEVDRVVWGRDRRGEFSDRLPTDYVIEVEEAGTGAWTVVAGSADRAPFGGPEDKGGPTTAGLSAADSRALDALLAERKELERRIASETTGQKAFAGLFRPPDVIRALRRGDPEQPLEEVPPAVPKVLGRLELPTSTPEADRRAALADWIVSPANPLTWRVAVNRIWQGHFGVGLVETPSDFGRNGARPSHPELLDWLAVDFLRHGGSMRHLHRRIVLSAAYRQSARIDPVATGRDGDVRLLWRFPSRRLESEPIRDAMLAAAGRLDLAGGGPGFDLFDQRGGLSGFKPVESYSGRGLRRMVYAHKVRREREAVFGAFDCPDAGQATARRRESTTPIQALNLFNSRFTLEQSEALARRAEAEAGPGTERRIRRAWKLALGREPSPEELDWSLPVARVHGLPAVTRALFNSNEFLHLP